MDSGVNKIMDFRPIIVEYINRVLPGIAIRDGSVSFNQDGLDNYVSFYILNDNINTIANKVSSVLNVPDDKLDVTYDPLTTAIIQLDIRGSNSYLNAKTLHLSFETDGNKQFLRDNSVAFMGRTAITPLPKVKQTLIEEGYLFDVSISYDNSLIDQVDYANVITLDNKDVL